MKKILLLFFLVSLCGTIQVMAQALTVTGKVTTSEDGSALPGATVKIKGTQTAVSTDSEGKYSIRVNGGQVLVFSFIGSITAERTVGSTTTINVELKSDITSLQEVVVTTGFGVKQEKRDLTSAVQTIKGADIASTQRENFLNALQGRVAGATVTSTSGQPGASSQIVLRGITSIGGSNSPLFVVDGIRVNNDATSQSLLTSNGANRSADFTNRIADLNPDDIENVTVLKGADAAAVYGSDAAGGAIVITTKKGKSGVGSVSYDNSFLVSNVYRFPQVQNVFGSGLNGVNQITDRRAFGPAYATGTTTYDNLKNYTQTGFSQSHSLAFEGGTDQATYRLSGDYRHQGGVVPVAYNNKLSLRFAGTAKISPKLTSSASFNYFNVDNRKLSKGQGGNYLNALVWPTNDDVRNYLNPDGSRRLILAATTSVTDAAADFDNPFFDANKNISQDKTNRVIGNVDLNYDPFKWFNIRALVGVDSYTTQGNNFISQYSNSYQNSALNGFASTTGFAAGGIIDNYNDNNLLTNGSLFGTFKYNAKDLRASLAVGGEAFDSRENINGFYGEKFLQPDFNTINNTTPTAQRNSSYLYQTRRLAGVARLNVVWKEMFVLNATARQDYSSRLVGTTKYTYFYPSVGAGFIFTELPGLKGNKVLNYGKIRFSYASVGKDPLRPYTIFSSLLQQATTGGGYAYDVTGNNPNLKAENDRQLDIGAELQFFNGRLGADISFYEYKAFNQIFAPRISYGSGFILEYINGGEIRNRGIDASITGIPVKTKDFTWNTTVNFSLNRGKVISLGGLPEYYNSDTWGYANVRYGIFPGSSLLNISSAVYATNNAGQRLIDPNSGLPISSLTTANGTTGFTTVGDRQPKFTVGFVNRFAYKSFDLSFLVDIRKGGDVANLNELFLTRQGFSARTLDRMTPRVVQGVLRDGNENSANPTINTISVNPYYQSSYYTSAIESDFIEHNINWVRLRDVTLGYTLPQSIIARQKVFKSASVFVTATELFLLTNYTGADPDVNANNTAVTGAGSVGFDYGTLATPRTISFGVRVKL